MAKIVLGIGTSHSPQLSVRASDWAVLREKDEHDPRLDYQNLLQRAKPNLDRELTTEKFRQRDERARKRLRRWEIACKRQSGCRGHFRR
jgi:3-O-methylgallate 3,4-dioxygenase